VQSAASRTCLCETNVLQSIGQSSDCWHFGLTAIHGKEKSPVAVRTTADRSRLHDPSVAQRASPRPKHVIPRGRHVGIHAAGRYTG
jgi:hypothetical protein